MRKRASMVCLCVLPVFAAAAGCMGGAGDEGPYTQADGSVALDSFGTQGPPDYSGGHDAASEARADCAADSAGGEIVVHPDVIETEAVDAAQEEAPASVCDFPVEAPQVLYLSADDSNSQASPIIARWMINNDMPVPSGVVRTYEFLNYYDIAYNPAAAGRVNVVAQMRPDPVDGALYDMQIVVQSHMLDNANRRPMNITFSLDTSGSMAGRPISLLKAVCIDIAGNLKAGDVVSMVRWNTIQSVVLDSLAVSGPDDPRLLDAINGLNADSSTDLNSGLVMAYTLAGANYDGTRLNRVVLVSDGQANVGVTEEDLIAENADDSEGEGIYLVGVGTGDGFNDTLMDVVTDAGKGAYIFIDTPDEAHKMFREKFLASLEIAVMDVQVQLTLPPVLRMEIFFGEEYSSSPKEVDPQHLAPNDAMIFQQKLRSCGELTAADTVRVVAAYKDPVTRESRSDAFETSAQGLLEVAGGQLEKGAAIVEYAEALKKLGGPIGSLDRDSICAETGGRLEQAAADLDDDELREISDLFETYCSTF